MWIGEHFERNPSPGFGTDEKQGDVLGDRCVADGLKSEAFYTNYPNGVLFHSGVLLPSYNMVYGIASGDEYMHRTLTSFGGW